jgi:hypothetical protein
MNVYTPGGIRGCGSSTALLSLLYSLFFGPEGPKNRGDWTPVELFFDAVEVCSSDFAIFNAAD